MISSGLFLTNLNLFDGTGEMLIANIQQRRQVEKIVENVRSRRISQVEKNLMRCRKQNQNLLNLTLPKHIVKMIRSGIVAFGLCESFPLLTVLFASIVDFKPAIESLSPSQTIGILNGFLNIFDDIAEKFDVFKIQTVLDASHMIVSGLHDRSNMFTDRCSLKMSNLSNNRKLGNQVHLVDINSTETMAYLSLELLQACQHLINPITRKPFQIKIGFHVGSAIGIIVGNSNLQYCLFGEAVRMAQDIMLTSEVCFLE